ncbi:response regulator transcription factor [Anaeromicropila herbilytica]|uniref:Stage 0 sporulation protein A homolog n=1 Tax=Anaeromicropila herbilytica TaxID=2785025 RepID=A0A7R7IBL2_9FIRM|nr:response regulator transcription factor [Anaeromicropila herbilytica]BCN29722.1 DNA-binding response regulator [Anaeromicropila herbilytica]
MRLLLIEDDKELCEAVEVHIKKESFELDICNNGEDSFYYLENTAYDVIILDRMLPGMDGIKILEKIREKGNMTPVIMVTAMNGINDRIDGLDSGADDYLVKPYAVEELLARIRALLRRPRKMENADCIEYSDLMFYTNTHVLANEKQNVSLSKKEGALLEFLLINKEKIITREQILSRVWGKDCFVEDGNIDNYIFFIRRRLKAISKKVVVTTIHGIGYRLEIKGDRDV